jgi:hypothetical protein
MGPQSHDTTGIRMDWATGKQLIIWLVAALLTYSAMNSRMAVLEVEVANMRAELSDMRADVKVLLRRP